jgi:hypothetical protein
MLLAELRIARPNCGRPRANATALRGEKTYSSRGHRAMLRRRGIVTVLAEPVDVSATASAAAHALAGTSATTSRTTSSATSSSGSSTA